LTDYIAPIVYPLRGYDEREMLHGVGEDEAERALEVIKHGRADQIESMGEEWVARVGPTVFAAMRSKRRGYMVLYGWPDGYRGESPEAQYAAIISGWNIGGFYL
jgi:hypothetical protein